MTRRPSTPTGDRLAVFGPRPTAADLPPLCAAAECFERTWDGHHFCERHTEQNFASILKANSTRNAIVKKLTILAALNRTIQLPSVEGRVNDHWALLNHLNDEIRVLVEMIQRFNDAREVFAVRFGPKAIETEVWRFSGIAKQNLAELTQDNDQLQDDVADIVKAIGPDFLDG